MAGHRRPGRDTDTSSRTNKRQSYRYHAVAFTTTSTPSETNWPEVQLDRRKRRKTNHSTPSEKESRLKPVHSTA